MAEYIRRDLAYKAMCDIRCGKEKGLCVSTPENCLTGKIIAQIPAEPVAPAVPGRWRWCGQDRYNDAYVCSNCGKIAMDDSNYCPNCGSKMEGEYHGK